MASNRNGNGNGHSNGAHRLPPIESIVSAIERERPASIESRLPPHNIEAERSVLGAILLEPSALHDVALILRPDDFYRATHQLIFRRILDVHAAGVEVNLITVSDELGRRGELANAGGFLGLGELAESVPHAANAKCHAGIVREKSRLRSLSEAATVLIREVYSREFTADQLIERFEGSILRLASGNDADRCVSVAELLPRVVERIESRRGGHITGLSSGFKDLDFLTGGFEPGQLIVLAARPSHGKSALAWSIAEHSAVKAGLPVLFASLEMTAESLCERALSSWSKVDGNKIRTGHALSDVNLEEIRKASRSLSAAPILIDDTPCQSMLKAASVARRVKLKQGLGLYVFDYGQLADAGDDGDSRQERVAAIFRRLKAMARELDVPVLALSQLNRKPDEREDHRPLLGDLRESGGIEQDADIVILMHRPERYDANDRPGITIVEVAKNRTGGTGALQLLFRKELTRFESISQQEPPVDFGEAPAF